MALRGSAAINENFDFDKWKRTKLSVIIGVLIILAIIAWHFYANWSNEVQENELGELTQKLYTLELQNKPFMVHLNLQCKTERSASNDCSQKPLFDENIIITRDEDSTIELLKSLYRFYSFDVRVPEEVKPERLRKELDFLNAILKTPIMKQTMAFLGKRGFKVNDHEDQLQLLQNIWFTPYSRSKGPDGSTGFEHVFLAEIRQDKTLGLHNWVFFLEQEKKGNINYHGYIEHIDMGKNNHHLLSMRFDFHKKLKKYNGIMIGSSPELEISLYTVCFLLHGGTSCPIQLGSTHFSIMTYSIFNAQKDKTLGSAYISLTE